MLSIGVAILCGVSVLSLLWPSPSLGRADRATDIWSAVSVPPAWLVITALAVVAVAVHSAVVLVEGVLVVAIVRQQRTRATERQSDIRTMQATAEFLDQVVIQLQSGSSLRFSLVSVAQASPLPGSHELAVIAAQLHAGAGLSEALAYRVSEPRSATVEIVATTLEVLHRSGAAAAPALERTGDTVRERIATDADARTQSQQAMASAALIASLPALFAAFASIAEPELLDFYLHQNSGLVCIVGSTLLTVAGWVWIQWLVWGQP